MRHRRSLALRRELLTELSVHQAAAVAGGASGLGCVTVPDCGGPQDPWSLLCSAQGPCASDFAQCTTG